MNPARTKSNTLIGSHMADDESALGQLYENIMYKDLFGDGNMVGKYMLGKPGLDGLPAHTLKDYSDQANHVKARGLDYYGLFDGTDDEASVTIDSDLGSFFVGATHTIGFWFLALSDGESNTGNLVEHGNSSSNRGFNIRTLNESSGNVDIIFTHQFNIGS